MVLMLKKNSLILCNSIAFLTTQVCAVKQKLDRFDGIRSGGAVVRKTPVSIFGGRTDLPALRYRLG